MNRFGINANEGLHLGAAVKAKFWDNLISIKGGLFDAQTTGWQPGKPAMSGMGCQIVADEPVVMADGIKLLADIYLPKKAGRYPAILVFGAYSKEIHASGLPAGTNEVGSPPIFTDRGYAHVIVARRGMSGSQGETGNFFSDQDVLDHEAIIGWVARQPWCDGQVVLYGVSYFGCTQPEVAVRNPPALKGFFCNEICVDYFRHITMFGGTPGLYFLSLWVGANFTQMIVKLKMPPLMRAIVSHVVNSPLKSLWWPAMQKRLPAILTAMARNTPVRPVREIWANWLFDGKTRATNWIPAGPHGIMDRIEVPFVTIQNLGQFNLHQFGSYELFQKASTPANRKWMILAQPSYKLPVYGWQMEALAFFDHITRGVANGYAEQPPVRYWLDGADTYRSADNFPASNSLPLRLYPCPEGMSGSVQVLSANAPGEGLNTWAAAPRNAPILSGMDEVINQKLTYDFDPGVEIELSGAVKASLVFSCNEIDSYVLARVGRVDVKGKFHLLSNGAISPARRTIDTTRGSLVEIAIDIDTPQPLVSCVPVTLTFSLTPGPVRIASGEKLRFEVASRTDLMCSDVAHDHCHFDMEVPPYFSRNTLHCGPQTYVELCQVTPCHTTA